MSILHHDSELPTSDRPTRKRPKVSIGAAWRESQLMRQNATPRTMSREVADPGHYADILQRALLGTWMRDSQDRIVWRFVLIAGAVLAFAAWAGLL